MKKKKILIIGGTGFIGFHLAKRLVKKNYSVTSISTKLPSENKKLSKVDYLICDISKLNFLKKIIKKIDFDYVINVGGYVDHLNKKKNLQ